MDIEFFFFFLIFLFVRLTVNLRQLKGKPLGARERMGNTALKWGGGGGGLASCETARFVSIRTRIPDSGNLSRKGIRKAFSFLRSSNLRVLG